MRAVIIGVALAMVLAAPVSAEPTGELRKAIVEAGTALGEAAYHFGVCERYASPNDAAEVAAMFTGADAGDDMVSRELHGVWAKLYGTGRKEASQYNFSRDQCQRLLDEAQAKVVEARAKLERISR